MSGALPTLDEQAVARHEARLRDDPTDLTALRALGELLQRAGVGERAAEPFARAAEQLVAQGYLLKATALYKQVLKLDPSRLEVHGKLAELYQGLHLPLDAASHLQAAAQHYERVGDLAAALAALRQLVELDPQPAAQARRAELAEALGELDEARAALRAAAEALRARQRLAEYRQVAARLSALCPDDGALAREVAELHLRAGDDGRALERLEVALAALPRDEGALRLAAQVLERLGQPAAAAARWRALEAVLRGAGRGAESGLAQLEAERLEARAGQA